ncbi:MAG: hypothetical protein HQM08_11495 [Candidatus Riflebacteria bacterium]|nr:hypothetical protein [Candidatus Riflebacteria bacterium]
MEQTLHGISNQALNQLPKMDMSSLPKQILKAASEAGQLQFDKVLSNLPGAMSGTSSTTLSIPFPGTTGFFIPTSLSQITQPILDMVPQPLVKLFPDAVSNHPPGSPPHSKSLRNYSNTDAITFSLISNSASDSFLIPKEKPDTVITSDRLLIQSSTVILEGTVRATENERILTCGRAYLDQKPQRILASETPRLFQKESIFEKRTFRETTLDALNILWNSGQRRMSASPSVVVKVEERSWDLATFSEGFIYSDSMEGFPDNKKLNFEGNVRLKAKEYYGQGRRLDYDKEKSDVILSGDAIVEKEEYSEKEKRMVKRILNGQKIIYNTERKTAQSE